MLVLTNFVTPTSLLHCLAPGGGSWLWRCVRPESLTLANGGSSAGAALGSDWLQKPRRPIMTSEQADHALYLPPSVSPTWQPACSAATEMMNVRREVTNKQKPVSPAFFQFPLRFSFSFSFFFLDTFFLRGFSKRFHLVQGYKWWKKCVSDDICLNDEKDLYPRTSFNSIVPIRGD